VRVVETFADSADIDGFEVKKVPFALREADMVCG